MKPIKKKTTQKINPKEIQKSFMETVEESLVSQGVKFFEVDNGLNIDSEWLELPQSITEISSRELGECLNAFTQQKMYLRTLLGRTELWVEDAKRAYLSAGDKTYKALSNGKLSETAKERLINSDENVKPLYYEYRECVQRKNLVELNILNVEDAIFMLSREVSRRNADFNDENKNYSVNR